MGRQIDLFCGGATPNRNVQLTMVFTIMHSLSYGTWGNTVLSGFLQGMPDGNNAKVGFAEGIQGAMQALVAVPAGYLSDRIGRETVLKGSALIGVVSSAMLLLSLTIWKHSDSQYYMLCVSLGAFGAFQGASNAPLEALFHDSIAQVDRARVATTKYMLAVGCTGLGPLLSLFLFAAFGNDWGYDALTEVMLVGVGISAIPIFILFLPRNADALGRESEPVTFESPLIDAERDMEEYYMAMNEVEREDTATALGAFDNATDSHLENQRPVIGEGETIVEPLLDQRGTGCTKTKTKWWVPRIVVTMDLISGLASGMTIRFFPLFFKDETGLSPSAVNTIFVISPFLMAILANLCLKLSKRIGRVWVPIITNTGGIALLFLMYLLGEIDRDFYWGTWQIIVPIYLIRTALMNSTRPLRKALLMDYCSKESRGFVNSLESICAFGWSGSAVLGGILCQEYGYGVSFLWTAAIQAIALVVYASLLLFKVR